MSQERDSAIILIMGPTGTGKSTFINLLTRDEKIHIGHSQQSETFGVETAHFIDEVTGRPVKLIDTPGFDDSREGVTDADTLGKIVQFLIPESGEKIVITGIIYMHRISDPRVGGISRKNIKMFHALCGEKTFRNVRIVTTNWSRVTEDEGNNREADLKKGPFKSFVNGGAHVRRHTNTVESAQQIISEVISLSPVVLMIQEEVWGRKKLVDTGVGMVLDAEMQAIRKKDEQELADLEREMKDADAKQSRSLIAELEQEREVLQEKIKRANADRERLESTLAAAHIGAARSRMIGRKGTAMAVSQRSSQTMHAFRISYASNSTAGDPPFISPSAEAASQNTSPSPSIGVHFTPAISSHPAQTQTTEANPPFSSNEVQIRNLMSRSAETRQALGQTPPPLLSPYGNQFTTPPAGGFPHIELLTPTELLEHLDDELLSNWFGAPNPKLLIRPFKWQGLDPLALAEKIETSISEIASTMGLYNITGSISPPYAPSKSPVGLPTSFLVYGIPSRVSGALLSYRVWSSTKVTFEARAFEDTQPPALFLALSGFATLDSAVVKEAVQRRWSSERQAILSILGEHASSSPGVLQTAIEHFIRFIRVERVETTPARYNIYSENPPCINPTAWTAIRLYLAELQYPASITKDGIGHKERLIPCLICHSHTHPPELCPFPAIPGWNGPTL